MSNELPGYGGCWFREPHIENRCSRLFKDTHPNSVVLGESQLCSSNKEMWWFQLLSKTPECGEAGEGLNSLGKLSIQQKKICDANDLLVFSWEQKGFQYGEPNRIHYLTISSELMQDCASECALRKRVPDSLRWAGLETSILAGCREGFPPVCQCPGTLSSENGQRPTEALCNLLLSRFSLD